MTDTRTETPEAWVGCLGCYNAGALVGQWVDGTEAESITIASLHGGDNQGGVTTADIFRCDPYAGAHEELWVMDYQGYGEALSGECSPAEAARIARMIVSAEEASGIPAGAVAAWLGNGNDDTDGLSDYYQGEYDSERAFAEQYADDIGALDADAGWPYSSVDWEQATRELMMDFWSADAPGGVFIFRS